MFNIVESKVHFSLKDIPSIFQTKGNFLVCEGTPWKNKICFLLVFLLDLDLIVSRKTIHKQKNLATHTNINNLIYKGRGVVFLGTRFI